MNKIAQYENNMIYIIKKQEDFCQNKVNSSLVSSCTYKLQDLKVVQTPTQSEKVLDCYGKGKNPRNGIKPRHRSGGYLLVYCMELRRKPMEKEAVY